MRPQSSNSTPVSARLTVPCHPVSLLFSTLLPAAATTAPAPGTYPHSLYLTPPDTVNSPLGEDSLGGELPLRWAPGMPRKPQQEGTVNPGGGLSWSKVRAAPTMAMAEGACLCCLPLFSSPPLPLPLLPFSFLPPPPFLSPPFILFSSPLLSPGLHASLSSPALSPAGAAPLLTSHLPDTTSHCDHWARPSGGPWPCPSPALRCCFLWAHLVLVVPL